MTGPELFDSGLKLMVAAAPFLLVLMSITYAGEIIDVVKKSILNRGNRGGY